MANSLSAILISLGSAFHARRLQRSTGAGGQEITSDKRIKAALPTSSTRSTTLRSGAGEPLGRPRQAESEMSLKPVAVRLSELLGLPVAFAPDCVGQKLRKCCPRGSAAAREPALSRHRGKERSAFAKQLAPGRRLRQRRLWHGAPRACLYVGIIEFLKPPRGLLMEKELEYLEKCTKNPAILRRILGGAKVSDKIEVIENC